MSISRYSFSARSDEGRAIDPCKCSYAIHRACRNGGIAFTTKVLEEGERLDSLAGLFYGDASLWWIIASASGIGWGMQVPPGTLLFIPTEPGAVFGLLL